MKKPEIELLQTLEHDTFKQLLFAEKHFGMNDPVTEIWRNRWGLTYDILNMLGITPKELHESESDSI